MSWFVHPRTTVNDIIHGEPKEWDVEMLENLVVPEDIPLIQSLVVNQSNTEDKFCSSYTKSGQYP